MRDELTEINGVGEVTADKILEVVERAEEYSKIVEKAEQPSKTVEENVREAWDYYEEGKESYAGKYLRRAYNALE